MKEIRQYHSIENDTQNDRPPCSKVSHPFIKVKWNKDGTAQHKYFDDWIKLFSFEAFINKRYDSNSS